MTTATIKHSAETFHTDRHLIGGRYRMNARIGKGRLGEIFAAIDERFEKLGVEQHAAIQVIPESVVANNKLFNKLSLGYTMLKAGAHPNIVDCLQFGRDGKFGFLAMELLEGASLRALLDVAETLPPDEVKPVIRGVGEALGYLHAKGIVHGNVTATNVFVGENLETRILDVVPLASDDAIFRGAAMSGPFGRCTAQDDVFGLACLAYEMLSGKHPFNYCPPGEARLAGLEADRIASLTDGEWNALRLALSFEREQRTSSVADFMRNFGILGTERLRPASDQPVVDAADNSAAVQPEAAIADVAVDPFSWNVDDLASTQSHREERHRLRTAFLGTLLAGLLAWTYYGQPQAYFANVIGYVDETLDLGLVQHGDGIVEPVALVALVAPVVPEASVAVEAPVAPEASVAVEAPVAPADSEENNPEAEAATDAVQAVPETVVFDPFVSVSERDGAARITLQHNTNSTMQLTWWTSGYTAIAEQDFIAGKQTIMTGASLGENNTLHIPLINDNVPEPIESFFVNLELRNIEHGTIERIATVRVDINDDDQP